ncbi:hypothetical protein BHE74_00026961 [Ensete ventricosum]|nr:hypothetical protein BHE74_00026961 [Ensete ventricosum]
MVNDDLAATSLRPRTTGLSTWPTRRGKLVGRKYGALSGRTIDLAQARPNPQRSYDRPDTCKVDTLTCGRMPHRKDGGRGGGPTPVTGYEGSIHLAKHRLRPETTGGELAHKGLNHQCSLSGDDGRPNPLGRHQI